MIKRIIAIILTVALVCALLPTVLLPVSAATYSGTCGGQIGRILTWTLDTSTGVLSISGSGAMRDWANDSNNRAPWYSYRSSIVSVMIGSGVTSIGKYAFHGCSGLTSVTIPDSVTIIGDSAFYNCSGLTSVTIPDSVRSINYDAFSGCSGLTSVTIPDSVTSIASSVFKGCRGLTSISLPFVGNKPHTASDTNQYPFGFIFGPESYTGGTATEQYYYGSSTSSTTHSTYYIPSSLRSVTITGSSYIPYGAFYNCSGLTSVTIPDSVTSIGSYAFYKCSGLTSVTIPDSVTSIGSYAFSHCSGLTSVTIPDSVTSIGSSAFSRCSGLTSVTIPDSMTSINSYAFYDCSGLTAVHITDIAAWCSIAFSGSSANPLSNAHNLYLNGELVMDLVIPNSVTSIGDYAFYGCSGLTSVTIPDSVTSIGGAAFEGCSGLTSVTIGSGVTNIGNYAFEGCSGLTSITVARNNPVYDSRNNCNAIIETASNTLIIGCKKTAILDSVTSIGDSAFRDCTGLTSVTIPDSVTSIGKHAFHGCSGLTSVTIPDSVTSISSYAFSDCSRLNNVQLSNHLKTIGSYIFSGCSSLTSVKIPDNWSRIVSYMFANCTGLRSVTIPSTVKSIGENAFYGCTGLTSVTIPDSVTSIGDNAFSGCTTLASVVLGRNIDSFNLSTLNGCSALQEIAFLNPQCTISGVLDSNIYPTIYGHLNSTAEEFAIAIGYSFNVIDQSFSGTTCTVYNIRRQNMTLTVKQNIWDSSSEDEWFLLADEVYVLNGGKTYHLDSGHTYEVVSGNDVLLSPGSCCPGQIQFPYEAENVTVSKDGYVTRTFNYAQLSRNSTIYLERTSSKGPVICGVWMDDTDILHTDYSVDLLDSGTFTVTPEVNWCGNGPGTIRLIQRNKSVSLSTSGTSITWSDVFDVSDSIYIEAIASNGTSVKREVRLAASLPSSLTGKSVEFGDKMSFTLPDSAGALAGDTMDFGIFTPLKAEVVIDDSKVYIAYGLNCGQKIKNDKEGYKTEVKNFVKDVKDIYNNYRPSKLTSFIKEQYKKVKATPASFSVESDASLVGYAEGYINTAGDFVLLDCGLLMWVDGSIKWEKPFMIGIIPAYWEGKFSTDVTAQMNLYLDENANSFTPGGVVNSNVSLGGGVGVGVKKVFSIGGGITGQLSNTWEINPGDEDYYLLKGSIKAYASVSLLFYTYNRNFDPVVDATLVEYPHPRAAIKNANLMDYSAIYDMDNYELQDLSYLSDGSPFLANSADAKRGFERGLSATNEVFLQNAYENSKPQIVACPDGTMLAAWLGYDSARTGYDALCLYYSCFDGTDWSYPAMVEDDGTYDGDFVLKAIDGAVYVLWQDADQPVGIDPELEEISADLSISAGVFNTDSRVFQTTALTSQDGTLDMLPTLCGEGNTVYALWLNNAENDYFGDNAANAIKYSSFNGTVWSEAQTRYSNLPSVDSIAADYNGSSLQVAYCIDGDGDITTAEDTEVWINGVRKTNNSTCDCGVICFEGKFYWYQDGNLTCEEETPELTGLVTDRIQIVGNGSNTALVYNQYDGLNSTLYARYFDKVSAAWSEPIALTDGTNSYNGFSAAMGNDDKLIIIANRVAVVGEISDANPYGQADIVTITVAPKTDLAVTDIIYNCSEFTANADMTFNASVKNVGETAVQSMIAVITDSNGNELGRNLIVSTLLPGEETEVACSFIPTDIQLGQSVDVTILPLSPEDSTTSNNTITATLDFKDISLENTGYGFKDNNEAAVYADVVNRSYAATTAPITVALRENSEDGTVLDSVIINSLDAFESERVSFTVLPEEEKILYITIETQTENEVLSNDRDYVVATLPINELSENPDSSLRIVAASVMLDEDIDFVFSAVVPEGYINPYIDVNGTVISAYTEQDGMLRFVYSGITPPRIGDEITAVLHAEWWNGTTVTDTLQNYSVKQYCVNLLNNYPDDSALKTLLSDLLTYGAAAQTYIGYHVDSIVTDMLELTPSSFVSFSGKQIIFAGTSDAETDWSAATLALGSSLAIRFYFRAEDITDLSVRCAVNGRTQIFTETDIIRLNDASNLYYVDMYGIEATEFDDDVTAAFYRDNEQIGRTVSYSVNAYICSTQNSDNANLQALVRALYNYGASATAYSTAE